MTKITFHLALYLGLVLLSMKNKETYSTMSGFIFFDLLTFLKHLKILYLETIEIY